ncbi:MAG: MFS transporter [Chloroflexota bacterium]
MQRSIRSVLVGTFTLRFSTGLTGALLIYYLADLDKHGGQVPDALAIGVLTAAFYLAELVLSPIFGLLSDRYGHHRMMQVGPLFGLAAVIITGLSTNLWILGSTRVLEGASTAASVPSILGFIAMATANDEILRGKTSARFEAATIVGIGAGLVVAGPLWRAIGPLAFFLNGGIYLVSLAIYRYGVEAPDAPAGPHARPDYGWRRYVGLLRRSHIWLLAPTWIAINAALGLYTSQALFQLVKTPDPRFADQALVGGFDPILISVGLVAMGFFFFVGLWYWGNRFADMRRTTIILYGIGGGVALVVGALLVNHGGSLGMVGQLAGAALAACGVFVLAGATPAALGLLADISEAFPDDRGAVMGLYSVFLAIGQIIGAIIGGAAADRWAFDGILIATLVLMAVAVIPLSRLRRFESRFEPSPGSGPVVVELADGRFVAPGLDDEDPGIPPPPVPGPGVLDDGPGGLPPAPAGDPGPRAPAG